MHFQWLRSFICLTFIHKAKTLALQIETIQVAQVLLLLFFCLLNGSTELYIDLIIRNMENHKMMRPPLVKDQFELD